MALTIERICVVGVGIVVVVICDRVRIAIVVVGGGGVVVGVGCGRRVSLLLLLLMTGGQTGDFVSCYRVVTVGMCTHHLAYDRRRRRRTK